MAGIAVGGWLRASLGRLRSRHGEAWFGCAHGVSLERRKECVGRRSEGKKCCNGRESVKSMFEEVKGARKGRGGVGGKGGKEEWVTGGCGEGISVGCLENVENVGCRELVGGGCGKDVRHGDKDDVRW